MKQDHLLVDSKKIIETVRQLRLRIEERFPDSSLKNVCRQLHEIAEDTDRTIAWINQPNYRLRGMVAGFIVVSVIILCLTFAQIHLSDETMSLTDLLQSCDGLLNIVVLIGAVAIFLITFETRLKRNKVVEAVNRLRSIAHLIEAHQLTKDPAFLDDTAILTKFSPVRQLSPFLLGRYLDYCSEMLSLTSNVAFLYVQQFHDPVAVDAVNDLENLTTGLSRKIWQKIILIRRGKF